MKELDFGGIYFAPFAGELAMSIVIFLLIRRWFDQIEIHRGVWHRRFFDAAIFMILLSCIGLLF